MSEHENERDKVWARKAILIGYGTSLEVVAIALRFSTSSDALNANGIEVSSSYCLTLK